MYEITNTLHVIQNNKHQANKKIQQEQSIPQTSKLPKQAQNIDSTQEVRNFALLKEFLKSHGISEWIY